MDCHARIAVPVVQGAERYAILQCLATLPALPANVMHFRFGSANDAAKDSNTRHVVTVCIAHNPISSNASSTDRTTQT